MVDGIDFKNLSLTPDPRIGVKYNRYRVNAGGREYELQLLQAINATHKRYSASLMGGEEVEYLDSIDLDKITERQAKDRLRRELLNYIKRNG